jgi:hypothetical protein
LVDVNRFGQFFEEDDIAYDIGLTTNLTHRKHKRPHYSSTSFVVLTKTTLKNKKNKEQQQQHTQSKNKMQIMSIQFEICYVQGSHQMF